MVSSRIKKALLVAVLSLLTLLTCLGTGLLPVNLFFLKPALSEALREDAGLDLQVDGPLRLRLGLRPRLTARDITIGKVGDPLLLAAIGKVSARTRLASLLRGQIDLLNLDAQDITLLPGRNIEAGELPLIDRLQASAPLDGAVDARLEGSLAGTPWAIGLNGASLQALLAGQQDYPLETVLNIGSSQAHFEGVLSALKSAPRVDGEISVQSENLSGMLSGLGMTLEGFGAVSVRSRIHLERSLIHLDEIDGNLDGFAFSGSARVRNQAGRPEVQIAALIPILDVAALPGQAQSRASSSDDAAVDLQPLFSLLEGFDGQAEISVGEVLHAPLPIRDLVVSASLAGGRLTIGQASAQLAGVDLTASATLDTTLPCARLETAVEVPEMDLAEISHLLLRQRDMGGRVANLRLTTASCGNVADDHVSSLESRLLASDFEWEAQEEDSMLELKDLEAALNWRLPGRIAFSSRFNGEPITLSAGFGSIEQMRSDLPWPIDLTARSASLDLELSGKTAVAESGLRFDIDVAARLGRSDVAGHVTWSSLQSGLPLKTDLRSARLDLAELTALLTEQDAGEQETTHDWAGFLDQTNLFEEWHAASVIEAKLAVDRLEGTKFEIGGISLDARVEGRRLQGGRMGLDFEGVSIEGVIDADMSRSNKSIDYRVSLQNLDIGRLLKSMDLTDTVDAHAERADVRLQSQGLTIRELAENLDFRLQLQALQYTTQAGPESRPFDILLSDVSVSGSPGMDMVWETRGSLNESPIEAWMRTPDLRDTFDRNRSLPLRLIVKGQDDILMFDLTFHPEDKQGKRTDVLVSGRYSSEVEADFSALPSPLEDFTLGTRLHVNDKTYRASDIDFRLGSSRIHGQFSIEPENNGVHFEIDANAPYLETDDLVRWLEEYRKARDALAGAGSYSEPGEAADGVENPAVETLPEAAAGTAKTGLIALANEYLEAFIGDNSWSIAVAIDELRSAGKLLGKTGFELNMGGRQVILDPATIELPDGTVEARYASTSDESGWNVDLDIHVERLEYGGLLRLLDPTTNSSGRLYLDTSLRSRALEQRDIVNNLQGKVDIAVFPDDVGAKFLDLWASNLVLALLPVGDSRKKQLNCLVARFDVENGVMDSRVTLLDSTDIIVRTRGEIDLARRQLDLLAAPQAKVERFLSVSAPIEITGPFDDFTVGVASGGFVMTMIRWYYGLIYVPWKWLTGERFPADGIATCYNAMDWPLPE